MNVVHSVIGINSGEYDKNILNQLSVIYSHQEIECDMHIGIMGPHSNELKQYVPQNTNSSISIQTSAYNYSLSINCLLKQISTNYPFSTVIITDGWTIISPFQIIDVEFKNIDWDRCFITIPTILDDPENPFNIYSEKFHNAYFSRIKNILWKSKENKYVPLVIAKVKYLTELECGLEEELFTEYSRLHLINQLKSTGLEECISEKNIGLSIRKRREKNKIEDKDILNITQFSEKTKNSIFIPSNYQTDWGDASKIAYLRRSPNMIPFWKLKTRSKINLLDTDNMNYIETETKERGDILEVVFKNCELNFDKNFKILITINSDIQNILGITPLIKGIYKKWGFVDIVTDDVLNPALQLIRNSMIDKIYKIDDFYNGITNFNNYGTNIIKAYNSSNIRLPENIDIIEPLNIGSYSFEKNYSVIDPCIEKIPEPYCNYTPYKRILSSQTISIIISIINRDRLYLWKDLSVICSKLANNSSNNILLLSLNSEYTVFDTKTFILRKNINILGTMSEPSLAGIINASNLVIVPSESNASYICWALKKNSILIDTSGNSLDFKPSDSMTVIPIHPSKKQLPIQTIFEELIDKI